MAYLIAAIVFVINIPFGFWRGSLRKFSFLWFVSIHAPVLVSIFLRKNAHISLNILNIVLFVSVFFFGQLSGKYSYALYKKKSDN